MAKTSPAPELNPRQRFFVEEYLIDLNAKEAAIRAGYSRRRAASRGYALLQAPPLRAAIAEAMARRAASTGITPDRVIEEYARIAFADWRRFADWGPKGVRFAAACALSADDTPLIAALVDGGPARGGLRRVKLFDKQAALTSLARILTSGDTARLRAAPAPVAVPPAPAPPPSERQRRFAEEYLTDFNAYRAACRAGYTERTAALNMTKMKRHPATAALIASTIESRCVPIRVAAARVLEEYARIAFADIGRIADWDSRGLRLKPQETVAAADSAAIAAIGAPRGARLQLRLHDKIVALDALARHLGLLDGRVARHGRQRWQARETSAALRGRLARP